MIPAKAKIHGVGHHCFAKIIFIAELENEHCEMFAVKTRSNNTEPPVTSNRNALMGQKVCHYYNKDRTLNDLLRSQQTKI